MKATHGGIARQLIANDPHFFNDLKSHHSNSFSVMKNCQMIRFVHVLEMKKYIFDKLNNSGLDNSRFVNGVINALQILLQPVSKKTGENANI